MALGVLKRNPSHNFWLPSAGKARIYAARGPIRSHTWSIMYSLLATGVQSSLKHQPDHPRCHYYHRKYQTRCSCFSCTQDPFSWDPFFSPWSSWISLSPRQLLLQCRQTVQQQYILWCKWILRVWRYVLRSRMYIKLWGDGGIRKECGNTRPDMSTQYML